MRHGIAYKESKTQFPAPFQYGDRTNKPVICACSDRRRRSRADSSLSVTRQHCSTTLTNTSTDEASWADMRRSGSWAAHPRFGAGQHNHRSRSIPRRRPMFRSRSRATWGGGFLSGKGGGYVGGFLRGEGKKEETVVPFCSFPVSAREGRRSPTPQRGDATSVRGPKRSVSTTCLPFPAWLRLGFCRADLASCSWVMPACPFSHYGRNSGHCMRSACVRWFWLFGCLDLHFRQPHVSKC